MVVRAGTIASAGGHGDVEIPAEAQRLDASGKFLLPGMLDTHFHTSRPDRVMGLLTAGSTSFRNPGLPSPAYEQLLDPARPMLRGFLTGAHFDQRPHAHPHNSVDLRTSPDVRRLVRELHADGFSAIKVYYRLPLELIRAASEEADTLGVPVTAHLELVRADSPPLIHEKRSPNGVATSSTLWVLTFQGRANRHPTPPVP